MRATIS
jgi:hypothetical protein